MKVIGLDGIIIIPDSLIDKTECKRYLSRGCCQFGVNFNNAKAKIIQRMEKIT